MIQVAQGDIIRLEELTQKLIDIEENRGNDRFNFRKNQLLDDQEIRDAAQFLSKYEVGMAELADIDNCTAKDFIVLFKKIGFLQNCQIWFSGMKTIVNVWGPNYTNVCWIKKIALTMYGLHKILCYLHSIEREVKIEPISNGIKLTVTAGMIDIEKIQQGMLGHLPSNYFEVNSHS